MDVNDDDLNAMDTDDNLQSSFSDGIIVPYNDDLVLIEPAPSNLETVHYLLPNVANEQLIPPINQRDNGVNSDTDRVSPTLSSTSSRIDSPALIEDSNSNQSVELENTEKKTNTPPEINTKTQKRALSDDEHEDDGRICPICLDYWTNTGDHRICALKCGHLFGYKCVDRWLSSQDKKSCPTCKKRVLKKDIRYIYAKKLVAIDTTELDNMKKQLDVVAEEKNKIQVDLTRYICREHALSQEIIQLKSQISQMISNSNHSFAGPQFIPNTVKLYMEKSLEICRQSGCRVLDSNCSLDLIVASMKSPNNFFYSYGVRKINTSTHKPLAFLPLHNAPIRDITFHEQNDWFLTASMDKSFKISDCRINNIVHNLSQEVPLWSCCWDSSYSYFLYVGTQVGTVLKYDIRALTAPIASLLVPGDMSPVVSVVSMKRELGGLPNGGVVSCKLNSVWFFDHNVPEYTRHPLPIEGPFYSMKYNQTIGELLVSSRPNARVNHSRHSLCFLKANNGGIDCNIRYTFQGAGMQKLLSRTCFVMSTSKSSYIAAHEEVNKTIQLWDITNGFKVSSIPAHESVLDLCGVNPDYLIALTERKLEFFKFT